MALDKMYKRDRDMTDDAILAADFRAAYRNSIVKQFARDIAAPISTARRLIYEGVWPSRRREAALVLLKKIDSEIADLALVRARMEKILEDIDAVAGDRNNKSQSKDKRAQSKVPREESRDLVSAASPVDRPRDARPSNR